jgi:hypothetical protein
VKPENACACVTVKSKVFENSGSAVLPVVPSCAYEVLINTIIEYKTRLISHAPLHVTIYMFSWNKPICKKEITYNISEQIEGYY